jgi:hypothetical protein
VRMASVTYTEQEQRFLIVDRSRKKGKNRKGYLSHGASTQGQ